KYAFGEIYENNEKIFFKISSRYVFGEIQINFLFGIRNSNKCDLEIKSLKGLNSSIASGATRGKKDKLSPSAGP
ncbi:hypothetical protein, partial [Algoriphagus sp.]|uniref:hypothetical protein n=1 Tax=Algoriphagus sp. TaxID=1872435 RepID=UPI00257A3775